MWDKLNPNLSFAEGELAWCSIHKNLRIFKFYTGKSDNGGRIHPTQKPIALYSWLLEKYAIEGMRIFDPFIGSGSSRIAAYMKGFDFYGCELNPVYFQAQEDRFRRECFGEQKLKNGKTLIQESLF